MNTWMWGIDVGSKRVAVCLRQTPTDDVLAYQVDITTKDALDRSQRLWGLHQALQEWWPSLVEDHPPFVVWVEQPAGRFANPTLYAAWGIVLVTLRQALEGRTPFPVSVQDIVPTQWKKAVVGAGNASKEQTAAWAREEGFTHESGDVIDAYGILVAGELATTR